jgi:hypothetical protein
LRHRTQGDVEIAVGPIAEFRIERGSLEVSVRRRSGDVERRDVVSRYVWVESHGDPAARAHSEESRCARVLRHRELIRGRTDQLRRGRHGGTGRASIRDEEVHLAEGVHRDFPIERNRRGYRERGLACCYAPRGVKMARVVARQSPVDEPLDISAQTAAQIIGVAVFEIGVVVDAVAAKLAVAIAVAAVT